MIRSRPAHDRRRLTSIVVRIAPAVLMFGSVLGTSTKPVSAAIASSTCTVVMDENGEFDISWTLGSDVAKYVVERTVNGRGPYWRAAVKDPGVAFHDNVAWHEDVIYQITSKDTASKEIDEPVVCTNTPPPPRLPHPDSTTCSAIKLTNGAFDVTWTLGDGVDKYVIKRTVNGRGPYWRGASSSPETFFNDNKAWHDNVVYQLISKDSRGQAIGEPVVCTTGTALLAVGDMAKCDQVGVATSGAEKVSQLLDLRAGAEILVLGDLAYTDGRDFEFECYHQIFGQHKANMIPTVGNHEYGQDETLPPTGYWDYFRNEGTFSVSFGPQRTISHDDTIDHLYYETWVDDWQVLVLNSECFLLEEGDRVGDDPNGCDTDSLQYDWLESKLQEAPGVCRIATLHRPRWTSTAAQPYHDESALSEIVDLLDEYGTDLVLTGHSHKYENFLPQDSSQNLNEAEGFQLMVIGTGGRLPLAGPLVGKAPNSDTYVHTDHGIVELRLGEASYSWQFVSAETDKNGNPTEAVLDSGSRRCVNRN